MPFFKDEKYPNEDINYDEENDNDYNIYYSSGSPDFSGNYHSDIDAAGQFKYENNNNNLYSNNPYISFASNYNTSGFLFFGNSNNNIQGGLFGNSNNNMQGGLFTNLNNSTQGGLFTNNTNTNSLFGANKTSLFGNNYNKGINIFGNNNSNNNTKNIFSLFNN